MGKVLRPVFGKPCYDCEEQVPMARVRIIESDAIASGNVKRGTIRCVQCQCLYDNETKRLRDAHARRPRAAVVIGGGSSMRFV